MELFLYMVIAVASFSFLACIWGFVCNERTYRDRVAMIPEVEDPEFSQKLNRLDSVDYDSHLWAHFKFRDPMKLYENVK